MKMKSKPIKTYQLNEAGEKITDNQKIANEFMENPKKNLPLT